MEKHKNIPVLKRCIGYQGVFVTHEEKGWNRTHWGGSVIGRHGRARLLLKCPGGGGICRYPPTPRSAILPPTGGGGGGGIPGTHNKGVKMKKYEHYKIGYDGDGCARPAAALDFPSPASATRQTCDPRTWSRGRAPGIRGAGGEEGLACDLDDRTPPLRLTVRHLSRRHLGTLPPQTTGGGHNVKQGRGRHRPAKSLSCRGRGTTVWWAAPVPGPRPGNRPIPLPLGEKPPPPSQSSNPHRGKMGKLENWKTKKI